MDDASYDYVVFTFTLCSIPDVSQALLEINRVLKPRGNFVFLEHGLSDVTKVQAWQHGLNPLQKKLVTVVISIVKLMILSLVVLLLKSLH